MARSSAFRGAILHCLADPGSGDQAAVEYFDDGILLVDDGLVSRVGPAEELLKALPAAFPITDLSGKLIIPGMVDCHVHYKQT